MAKEILLQMAGLTTLKGSIPWPWPWIGSYCIPSCITRRPLPTRQISLKSNKIFVDRRTWRTFEINFIRSTLSKSWPNKTQQMWRAVPNVETAEKSIHDASLWLLSLLRRRGVSLFTLRLVIGVTGLVHVSAKRSRWLCTASTATESHRDDT